MWREWEQAECEAVGMTGAKEKENVGHQHPRKHPQLVPGGRVGGAGMGMERIEAD